MEYLHSPLLDTDTERRPAGGGALFVIAQLFYLNETRKWGGPLNVQRESRPCLKKRLWQ